MKILPDWLQNGYLKVIDPVANWLVRRGVHPNTITAIGTMCTVAGGAIYASGHIRTGGWFLGMTALFDVLDGTVVRVPKAYPAYFGEYRGISRVRSFLDQFPTLFPIGRNGMHRYNNQDHSMLAAKAAVECIIAGSSDKASLWSVNVEDEYHEQTSTPAEQQRAV